MGLVRDEATSEATTSSKKPVGGKYSPPHNIDCKHELSALKETQVSTALSPDEKRRDITNWMTGLAIFLLGLGIAWWANYDLLSSLLLAAYVSLGVTHGVRYFVNRRARAKANAKKPILLEELEGATFRDSEHSLLILTNKKASRLLSIYQVLRGNAPEVPLTLINTVVSLGIPLHYMNLGNSKALLAVEHMTRGSKKRQEGWDWPKISARSLETIKHHCAMVESGLEAGGIDFEPTVAPPDLTQLLKLSSHGRDGE